MAPFYPHTQTCFASLLHGNKDEYFVYACVLGRRLCESSDGSDRVLLCGPGCCEEYSKRVALREAGWNRLLAVDVIAAPHLDKTASQRHLLVFTKLRALELPYARVVFLDLDILPRDGCDLSELFTVDAPAGKYHNSSYYASDIDHGDLIPWESQEVGNWCINAGVMRLDPERALWQRVSQVQSMIEEIKSSCLLYTSDAADE